MDGRLPWFRFMDTDIRKKGQAKSSKCDPSSIFGPGFFVRLLVFATTGLSRLAEITESKIRAKMSPQMYKE